MTNDDQTQNPHPVNPEPEQAQTEHIPPQSTGPQPRTAFSRQGAWVAIVFTIVGGLIAVGALGQAVWDSAVSWPQAIAGDSSGPDWDGPAFDETSIQWEDSIAAEDLADVTAIEVQSSSSELVIDEGIEQDATLLVETTPNRTSEWTFAVDGDTLIVHEESGDDFGWGRTEATLWLPPALLESAPALDVDLQAGAAMIGGTFGDVAISVASGAGSFDGTAARIDVSVASGAFDVFADSVEEAAFSVGSGVLGVQLTGEAPTSTALDVSSGLADVTLPAGSYRVSVEVDSGFSEIDVPTSASATSTLEVNVSSGAASVTAPEE